MRIRRVLVLCSVLIAATPALAGAQEKHKAGITMGYPAAIGILWHVTDKVALRPELSFGGSSTDTSGSALDISGDGWTIGTGVSALFYLRTDDRLRTYISPRFVYGHSSSTSSTSGLAAVTGITTTELTQSTNSIGGIGSFGAQYAVGDRFTLFGEFGFGFSHIDTTASLTPTTSSGNSWGTRAGVGIVFYP